MGGKSKSAEPVICHVNLAKGFRGGERQTQLLTQELSKLGWKQRLVVRTGSALTERVADVDQLQTVEVSSNALAAGFATRGCQLVHAHEARAAVKVGFVVEVDLVLIDQGVGIVDGVLVPLARRAVGDHDFVVGGPRTVW